MSEFTLHDLQCFDAVARDGGFQAAAATLHRSHPAVFAAVAKLERQLGLALLDRSGYRVSLTAAGQSFHARAQSLLRELTALRAHAEQLAMGEETELRIVIGDFCPRPYVLGLLSRFFADCQATRLDLHFEAVSGPLERLYDGEADLILHRVDKNDARIEWVDLAKVPFVPVVAPGFLREPVPRAIKPALMRDYTQCVMRDTARHTPPQDYFTVEGARQCTVADQLMKKEIILQGMGWGHMPRFLVDEELRDGRLISIANRHLPGSVEELVAARRTDRAQGPVSNRLWRYLQNAAPALRRALAASRSR
ncbi:MULTISPECIES: LysR family transcriptional regulator [Achromobacter]|uniref:LysR family transcriptional regulator n=1 Tax=Achromobacter TaxID=222 RepID=UPI000F740938|nr:MULTISPECIES: LysR family transcriptional regulator [Achromobacter]MBD9471667.1 LysR family transcriptional regulator [Achromobacter sp. ACM01]RSE93010.1 LysR family transcriptional regulator [Achromobacter aegrifaciens]CAB3814625.1 HTH-type transcriptional regulator YhaJ [Achromobacter aegrifaciens]